MLLRTLICFLSCVFTTDGHSNAILEDVFQSIERTLAFYESNKLLITLDDVFALRLLEGQILVMNNRLLGSIPASSDHLRNIIPRLTTVYQYARNLSNTALNLLYRNVQWRSVAKSFIYQWPWTFAVAYRHLDLSLKWPADAYTKSLNEFSKHEELCFAELMKNGFERDCSISSVCTRVLFSRQHNLRDIERQLLYTLLIEQSGCLSEMNLRLISSKSVKTLQAELCTNIFFNISESILKNGNIVPRHLEGVFLNLALLCPFLGYMEFLHIDWLRQILSWQTSFGCWGSTRHSTEHVVTRVQSADRAVRQKRRIAGDKRFHLKAQANSAVGDFTIKRDEVKRLQGFDNGGIKRFPRLKRVQGRTDAEQNRTTTEERVGYRVTSMSTVFVRRRPSRRKGAKRTKDQLNSVNERLPLTESSDRVHLSSLPEGCVAPFTAIAIGALGQYLRFCLLAPLSQINPVDYLFGTNYILSPDKLSTNGSKANLAVKVYITRSIPTAATAVVGFVDTNLDHNFEQDNGKYEVKDEGHGWVNADWEKSFVKAGSNSVERVLDEIDEDGGTALEAQDDEDAVDYSYQPDDVIQVVDVSQDFKEKGSKDHIVQHGDYDSYYDNMDDDNAADQPMAWHFDDELSAKFTHSSSSRVMNAVDHRFDGVMAVDKSHAVLLAVLFLFVWLFCKSVFLKRRTGLLYRYNRWK